jgi:hypothetical protein
MADSTKSMTRDSFSFRATFNTLSITRSKITFAAAKQPKEAKMPEEEYLKRQITKPTR